MASDLKISNPQSPNPPAAVVADHRESRSGVPDLLRRCHNLPVLMRPLPAGDYLLPGGLAVERKRTWDLLASFHDGRLNRQGAALKLCYFRALLVVEGPGAHSLVHGRLQAAMARWAVRWQVPVLCTRRKSGTASLLASLCEPGGPPPGVPAPPWVRKHRDPRGGGLRLVLQLPGVGPVLARRLLEEFGSPAGVLSAGRMELARVPGVGRRRARKIWRIATTNPLK
ncbi:MAG: ERCC4 domain-containing protein [Halobacteria archaeon]